MCVGQHCHAALADLAIDEPVDESELIHKQDWQLSQLSSQFTTPCSDTGMTQLEGEGVSCRLIIFQEKAKQGAHVYYIRRSPSTYNIYNYGG